MKIGKYRYLKNSKYEVLIGDNVFCFYEDIIIKYEILLKKEISKEELEKYLKENVYYEIYYTAISYLNKKMRTLKEVRDYLKGLFSSDYIEDVLSKLIEQNLLNDEYYAKIYVDEVIRLKDNGPYKIIDDLAKVGIYNVNDMVLSLFDFDLQIEKIKKLVLKKKKISKDSNAIFKKKMENYFLHIGYDLKAIRIVLDDMVFDDKVNYEKEYKKVYDKLSKRYSGKDLELRIKQKMYQKGYSYE